jgi:hypothetical protein
MFASPKFIGKNYELEPTTMYIRREAYTVLEYFAYQTAGGSFGSHATVWPASTSNDAV